MYLTKQCCHYIKPLITLAMGTYRRNPDLSLTGFTSTKETERSPRGCIKTYE
nr:MAG TPA: hypothetical protein [Bacteriophage sp.]